MHAGDFFEVFRGPFFKINLVSLRTASTAVPSGRLLSTCFFLFPFYIFFSSLRAESTYFPHATQRENLLSTRCNEKYYTQLSGRCSCSRVYYNPRFARVVNSDTRSGTSPSAALRNILLCPCIQK